jgi:hypothetical protein
MTLYLDLPGDRGKLDRLVGAFGAVARPGPPRGLDAAPPDKALVCVGDMGEYEAPVTSSPKLDSTPASSSHWPPAALPRMAAHSAESSSNVALSLAGSSAPP